MAKKPFEIPDRILIPLANAMIVKTRHTPARWTISQVEDIKRNCGSDYGHVPCDAIRGRCESLRQSYKLQRVNGHAPTKVVTSTELQELYASSYWKMFAQRIRNYWGHRCAICYKRGNTEVHHRTYERMGHELDTDVIAVCKNCHKFCDKQRRRESGQIASEALTETATDECDSSSLFDSSL